MQITCSLLHNLLDVVGEVQLAQLEIRNVVQTCFRSSSGNWWCSVILVCFSLFIYLSIYLWVFSFKCIWFCCFGSNLFLQITIYFRRLELTFSLCASYVQLSSWICSFVSLTLTMVGRWWWLLTWLVWNGKFCTTFFFPLLLKVMWTQHLMLVEQFFELVNRTIFWTCQVMN